MSSTWPRRCLLLGHEKAELEGLLLDRGDTLLLGQDEAELEGFPLVRGEIFYSATARPSTRLRRCLLRGHEEAEVYSAAMTPPTRLGRS